MLKIFCEVIWHSCSLFFKFGKNLLGGVLSVVLLVRAGHVRLLLVVCSYRGV